MEAAEEACGGALTSRLAAAGTAEPVGPTPTVLLRADGLVAYPVINGIPILLAPERLVPSTDGPLDVDVSMARYAEAYEEMSFYNDVAETEAVDLEAFTRMRNDGPASFPQPAVDWLDALHEPAAQFEAYQHLAPMEGMRALQLGGKGHQAIAFLLAGAAEAWVISPMVSELLHARALGRRLGVEDRLRLAAGVAEDLPLASGTFDRVWGKSMHHMIDELAYRQCARVLRTGGRFAAVEPWHALLHEFGTHLLGKREPDVHCRPLDDVRVKPFFAAFPDGKVVRHGPAIRYALLALEKFGVIFSMAATWRAARIDDRLGRLVPGHNPGSCATLLATG